MALMTLRWKTAAFFGLALFAMVVLLVTVFAMVRSRRKRIISMAIALISLVVMIVSVARF